jgi:hypothetical protein
MKRGNSRCPSRWSLEEGIPSVTSPRHVMLVPEGFSGGFGSILGNRTKMKIVVVAVSFGCCMVWNHDLC